MTEIPNTLEIQAYIHCRMCAEEFVNGEHKGKSPQTLKNYDIGWTKLGLQIWCVRHDCNIAHIDFEGVKHHANMNVGGRD